MPAFGEGAPCWADAALPDLAAGRRFYGELLGWTFEDQGEEYGNYTMALRDGKAAAALMSAMEPGTPAAWSLYFSTADAARTAAEVGKAGGRVVFGPHPVGEAGVMAVAVDPAGSNFGLWQPGGHPGFGAVNEPGAFCWAEIVTQDAEAVDAFYTALFGYQGRQFGGGADFDYKAFSLPGGENPVLGRLKDTSGGRTGFQVYFTVADCDEAAATVRRLGGQVVFGPQDSPFGRTALVADDQGARFAVIDTQRTVGEVPA
jgi:predicted enzyme related to lactoylglutathione lyase